MSTIARKLCHDIVEPILKPSSNNRRKVNSSKKSENTPNNTSNNVKPKQTFEFENKKSVKIVPSNKTDSSKNRVKFNENEIKTKSVNSAINTPSSGPLSRDNNSLTLIHKRNHQKGISKGIQTICKKNFSISDKSCTHCVETVSCGTQFIDNLNGILKQSCSKLKPKVAIQIQDSKETFKLRRKQLLSNETNFKFFIEKPQISKTPSLRYVGAKYWALSNYPTRGPDF